MLLRLAGHPFSKNEYHRTFSRCWTYHMSWKLLHVKVILFLIRSLAKNLDLISLQECALRVTGTLILLHACTVYMTLCWIRWLSRIGFISSTKNRYVPCLLYKRHCFDLIALGPAYFRFFPPHVLKRSFLWPAAVLWSVERSRAVRERGETHTCQSGSVCCQG